MQPSRMCKVDDMAVRLGEPKRAQKQDSTCTHTELSMVQHAEYSTARHGTLHMLQSVIIAEMGACK